MVLDEAVPHKYARTMGTVPRSGAKQRSHGQQVTYRRQLALIGLITAVTLCAGWLGLVILERRLVAASGETISALAMDVASQIDLLLDERYRDIQTLAEITASPQTARGAIHAFQQAHPSYLWIGLTDTMGHVRQATDSVTVGLDVRRSEWYLAVLATSAIYVGDVRPDETMHGHEAITYAAPIRSTGVKDGLGSWGGVVSTRLGLQSIERLMTETIQIFQQRVGLFTAVEYQVVRDNGDVFIDSIPLHPGNVNLKEMGLRSLLLAASGTSGFIEEQHLRRKVPVVTGYARTTGRGLRAGLGWTVLLRVDRSDVLAPIKIVPWTVSLAAVLVAGPLIVMLVMATRKTQREWIDAEDERSRSRDNERRLQMILEVDPEGVLVLDRDRHILQINPAGCTLFAAGFPEEVMGKDVTQFIHLDDRLDFERLHEMALQGRGVVAKGRLVGLSGQLRWVEMTSVMLPDEGGQLPSVLGVIRDVTEQRRGDRRQALQHAVAKVLAESSSVEQAVPDLLRAVTTVLEWHVGLFWRVREDDQVLICAQEWVTSSAAVQDFLSVSHRHTFKSGVGLPGRCWARGEPLWVSDVLKEPGFSRGSAAAMNALHAACAFPIWLRANVYGVMEFFSGGVQAPDADLLRTLGIIASQIGLFIERAEVEAALRENESRIRLIIDTALDAVITTDSDGTIMEWNAQAEHMFGWSQHEAIGKNLGETIIPSVHRNAHREGLAQYCATGKAAVLNTLIEITALRRDGREFPVEFAIAPLRVEGAVIFSAFIRDITTRKEAERALTDYAQQLERINHQLDAALTEAKAATEAKSSFLATMSHEIRTPMNGVIGMTGLLLDTTLTSEQREYAETVRNCGDHLLTVINDILDFSKIEAGKLTLEVIEFDLRIAIEESLELLAERASSKGLNLACLFNADVPRGLLGDPGRLRQIVMNLAGNAIKFTERGEVAIQVTVDAQSEQEATIRIAVTDTGIGISEDAQQRLFQSFSQADGSMTRKYGGTGLGLAICKRLVEIMGGTIGVTSQPGQGSCFWFTVRLGTHTSSLSSPEPLPGGLIGLRVLIVDDKTINRRILEQLTKKWGMAPTLLDGGAAVVALLEHHQGPPPFDVALLDLDIGAMDGLELARTLKGRAGWAGLPLVLLTSHGRRGDAKVAREAGLAAYLTKPIRESQLHDGLVAVMERPAVVDRPASSESVPVPLITRYSVAEAKAKAALRILLAEDNIINQKVAVRLIERMGYRVDVVANGLEAVEALSRIPYGLVFMDCQMPEMDGFEATVEIRKREVGVRHTVIVAMTANAMQGDRERCLAAGMDDYVSKPVTTKALAGVFERRATAAAPAEPQGGQGALQEDGAIDPLIFNGLRELAGEEAPDFLQTLVGHFLKDVPESLGQMREALIKGDLQELARLAHRLKGSASNLGALGMAQLCERVRAAGKATDLERVNAPLMELEQEFERVRAELAREAAGGANIQDPRSDWGRNAA